MAADLESFGHLTIARRASGEPVRVQRSSEETVFLAFDTQIGRLVELHVISGGRSLIGHERRVVMDRARKAMDLKSASFMSILEVGEDQGLIYYTSNLNDGEFLADYILRRGALPPATVYSLLLNLLNDLTSEIRKQELGVQMQFDKVMITALEDTFLQLRVCDFGLALPEGAEADTASQVRQICEMLFLMLTGQEYAGENPDRFPTMTSLPGNLRTTVRAALTDNGNSPSSLEKLRDDMKEAHSAQVSSIQARTARKQLLATTTLQPFSQLQSLLLDGVSVEKILGNRFRIAEEDNTRQYPFAIPCLNVKNDQPITVHLLPPSRLISKSNYEAVPLQSWRFSPEKHPNILRSLSLWESNDWSFLTEEREPGFPLSRLLMDRMTLNPGEVVQLLRQTAMALEQALECSVEKMDLHPSNIFLRVGKGGALQARELDRLLQKRIDAWPPFLVKLRAHLTMRHLYEAPLVEVPASSAYEGTHQKDREHRHRSFVALAAYLLTGERNPREASAFPETIPDPLSLFIRQTLEIANLNGNTPNPSDFLERFESLLAGPATTDLATRLRGSNVALEEMESVGSVSDFEDEQATVFEEYDDHSPISRRLHAHEFDHRHQKRSSAWPAWAAAAVVVFGMLAWWFSSDTSSKAADTATLTIPSLSAKVEDPAKQIHAAQEKPVPKPEIPAVTSSVNVAAKITEPKEAPPMATEPKAAEPKVATAPAPDTSKKPAETPPAPAPKVDAPQTMASTPPAPAPPKPNPPALSPLPLTPPPPVTVPNPVIIRKAIMPSAEEIAKFKQGQVTPKPAPQPVQTSPSAPNQSTGTSPVIKLTGPLNDAALNEAQ
jgi:hypothetical protein